ncbi:segregation and condensation protein A [Gorillibacterium sp. sgz5001074]|uniref:segregation and condensation protein A n=1 Tax=Gorillibacterium sp. sgz5001074 TaxID=3446695 RepID=UPI003F67B0AD
MKVTFKLETFEGPLDLLLHLIDKAEVDIYNIPISVITAQYLDYIQGMQELELEVTSEFLVMAATLLAIKSKMLLPKPPVIEYEDPDWEMDGDFDPRAELVQKLIEYRKYKGIADHLREKEQERSLLFTREPADLSPFVQQTVENPVEGLGLSDLLLAFKKALRKQMSRNQVARIRRDEISVKDRIRQVAETLRESGGKILFSGLLSEDNTREEIVVTFLALLELMKMKQILCYQHKLFEDIVIQAREDGNWDGVAEVEVDY